MDAVGRRRESHDGLDPARAAALAAALGLDTAFGAGDPLPQLWHWIYFWDVARPADTGPDGHSARGDFLPTFPGARRMWAGGQLSFHRPLRLGAPARRISTIAEVREKSGRSGPLTFVTVSHEFHGPDGLAISERQDLVFRAPSPTGAPSPPAPTPAPADAWSVAVDPDPVLLFRYSALTLNSHRIHYDKPYAVEIEGYPGLVVHGPLQATLMLAAAARRAGAPAAEFRFRGLAPAFSGHRLSVRGHDDTLWIEQAGVRTMEGHARFEARP